MQDYSADRFAGNKRSLSKIFILSETTNRDLRALILFGPGPLPLDGKDLIDVWFHPGMRFFPVSVSVN